MAIVFFFAQTKRGIEQLYPNCFRDPTPEQARAGVTEILGGYGWYLLIERVAKAGVFTHGGKNAIQSVLDSDLHEVFVWLSAQNAQQTLEENIIKNRQAKARR